jgi:hypothetical protein
MKAQIIYICVYIYIYLYTRICVYCLLERKETCAQILAERAGSKCHFGNACRSRARSNTNTDRAKSFVASEVLPRFKCSVNSKINRIPFVYSVTFGFQQRQKFLAHMNKQTAYVYLLRLTL